MDLYHQISEDGKTAALTRQISVAYSGVNLVVNIRGGPAWIKVWIDGELEGPQSGRMIEAGSVDVLARIFSMGRLHHAMTGTGAIRRPRTPSSPSSTSI